MQVAKFGGTSVGSAYGLSCVKSLIEGKQGEVVVVVSALGGATDQLLRISKIASENGDYNPELNALKDRHLKAIDDSVLPIHQPWVWATTMQTIAELKKILASVAILEEISEKTSDLIVSFGERLSAPIVTGIFEQAKMINALNLFVTKKHFDKHVIDFCETNKNIKNLTLDRINVCSGFISKDVDGKRITNLGRGGSDYTAAIFAAAAEASVLEIYTDVDGFLTADPRVVEGASLIESLDFFDAIELCNYGAKVIYSPTIIPAFHKSIEIKIRNTFNAKCLGSSIRSIKLGGHITGISSINDLSLLRFVGNLNGLRYRLYKAMSGSGIEIFFAAKDHFGIHSKDVSRAINVLESEFSQELAMGRLDRIEVANNLAMVAVVGSFDDATSIKSHIIKRLKNNNLEIKAFGEDCSLRVITFVVPIEQVRGAIVACHDLIGVEVASDQTIAGDVVEQTLERLKQSGDVIISIYSKDGHTYIKTDRYREYPLRILIH